MLPATNQVNPLPALATSQTLTKGRYDVWVHIVYLPHANSLTATGCILSLPASNQSVYGYVQTNAHAVVTVEPVALKNHFPLPWSAKAPTENVFRDIVLVGGENGKMK